MAPRLIPDARPVLLVHHDRIDVLGRPKILTGPLHAAELGLGRVAGVDVGAFP